VARTPIAYAQQRRALSGSTRTYVFTGDRGLDTDAWFASLSAGQVLVSTGPLVELVINGRMPGDEVTLPAGGGTLDLDPTARAITSLDKCSSGSTELFSRKSRSRPIAGTRS
jgi:hypothetical protein